MQEKKPFAIFTAKRIITKDVIARDEGIVEYDHSVLSADIGIKITEYFGFQIEDVDPDEKGAAQSELHSVQVVAMTLAEFERLQEIEWIYKDLRDEE